MTGERGAMTLRIETRDTVQHPIVHKTALPIEKSSPRSQQGPLPFSQLVSSVCQSSRQKHVHQGPKCGLEEIWVPPGTQVQTWAPFSTCRESLGLSSPIWEPVLKSWSFGAVGAIMEA